MATRDEGYEDLRRTTLDTVREGYRLLRPQLDDAGITRADEEAAGAPADAFAAVAGVLRDVATHKDLRAAAGMVSDARALDLLALFARDISATWAEVRS